MNKKQTEEIIKYNEELKEKLDPIFLNTSKTY